MDSCEYNRRWIQCQRRRPQIDSGDAARLLPSIGQACAAVSGGARPQTDPRYHTSPLNFLDEVTREERFQLPIVLHDVTLREGEQAAEVAFSVDDRVEIARRLDAIGVPMIQAGYAGRDEEAVVAIKRAGVKAQVSVLGSSFVADWEEHIDRAADAGVDNFFVLMRTSDAMLQQIGLSREYAVQRACQAI